MIIRFGRLTATLAVGCGKCKRAYETLETDNRTRAARDLRRGGWERTRAFGWICPACCDQEFKRDALPTGNQPADSPKPK